MLTGQLGAVNIEIGRESPNRKIALNTRITPI